MRILLYILSSLFLGFISFESTGQCFENRHSTNWYDGWVSCEVAPSPNANRPASHWIMYDLEREHKLDRSYVWNYNDVANLDFGLQEVAIDYSLDGSTWLNAGTFTFPQADGSSTYAGAEGPNLGGVHAQYVLITAISNFGGTCYGLSEIRIEAEEINVATDETINDQVCLSMDVFPNPVRNSTRVYVKSDCKGDLKFQLINMLGQPLLNRNITDEILQKGFINLNTENLFAGEYILEIRNDKGVFRKTIIKM